MTALTLQCIISSKKGDGFVGIPERLVEIREKNGYTRKRLADELGRPYRTITKYETGEREPGHSYIVEIARKFGVSTDYILGASDLIEMGTKNPPAQPKPHWGEDVSNMFDKLNDLLVSEGIIKDGDDLTDRQAEILLAVCQIINAAF